MIFSMSPHGVAESSSTPWSGLAAAVVVTAVVAVVTGDVVVVTTGTGVLSRVMKYTPTAIAITTTAASAAIIGTFFLGGVIWRSRTVDSAPAPHRPFDSSTVAAAAPSP